jgi:hypothetical protein
LYGTPTAPLGGLPDEMAGCCAFPQPPHHSAIDSASVPAMRLRIERSRIDCLVTLCMHHSSVR